MQTNEDSHLVPADPSPSPQKQPDGHMSSGPVVEERAYSRSSDVSHQANERFRFGHFATSGGAPARYATNVGSSSQSGPHASQTGSNPSQAAGTMSATAEQIMAILKPVSLPVAIVPLDSRLVLQQTTTVTPMAPQLRPGTPNSAQSGSYHGTFLISQPQGSARPQITATYSQSVSHSQPPVAGNRDPRTAARSLPLLPENCKNQASAVLSSDILGPIASLLNASPLTQKSLPETKTRASTGFGSIPSYAGSALNLPMPPLTGSTVRKIEKVPKLESTSSILQSAAFYRGESSNEAYATPVSAAIENAHLWDQKQIKEEFDGNAAAELEDQIREAASKYCSIFDENLNLFQDIKVHEAYFSIRLPAYAHKRFYDKWSPLAMRFLQEKFGLTIQNVVYIQHVLTSAPAVRLEFRFTEEAITAELSAKVDPTYLRSLVGRVLMPMPGVKVIPYFQLLDYPRSATPWPLRPEFSLSHYPDRPVDPRVALARSIDRSTPEPNRYVPASNLSGGESNISAPEPNRFALELNRLAPYPNRFVPEPNQPVPVPNLSARESNIPAPEPNLFAPDPNRFAHDPNRFALESNQPVLEYNLPVPESNIPAHEPTRLAPDPNRFALETNRPVLEYNLSVPESNIPAHEPNRLAPDPNRFALEPNRPVLVPNLCALESIIPASGPNRFAPGPNWSAHERYPYSPEPSRFAPVSNWSVPEPNLSADEHNVSAGDDDSNHLADASDVEPSAQECSNRAKRIFGMGDFLRSVASKEDDDESQNRECTPERDQNAPVPEQDQYSPTTNFVIPPLAVTERYGMGSSGGYSVPNQFEALAVPQSVNPASFQTYPGHPHNHYSSFVPFKPDIPHPSFPEEPSGWGATKPRKRKPETLFQTSPEVPATDPRRKAQKLNSVHQPVTTPRRPQLTLPKSIGMPEPIETPQQPLDFFWNYLASIPAVEDDAEMLKHLKAAPRRLYLVKESYMRPEGWLLQAVVCDQPAGPFYGVSEMGAHIKLITSLFPFKQLVSFLVRHDKTSHRQQAQHETWGRVVYEHVRRALLGVFDFLDNHEEPRCDRLHRVLQEFQAQCEDFSINVWRNDSDLKNPFKCALYLYSTASQGQGDSESAAILEALKCASELPFIPSPELIRRKWARLICGWTEVDLNPDQDVHAICDRINDIARFTLEYVRDALAPEEIDCDVLDTELKPSNDGNLYDSILTLLRSVDSNLAPHSRSRGVGRTAMLAVCESIAMQCTMFPSRIHHHLVRNLVARILGLRPQTPWARIVRAIQGTTDAAPSLKTWLNLFLMHKKSFTTSPAAFEQWLDNPSLSESLVFLHLTCQLHDPAFEPRETDQFFGKVAVIQEPRGMTSGAEQEPENLALMPTTRVLPQPCHGGDQPLLPTASAPRIAPQIAPPPFGLPLPMHAHAPSVKPALLEPVAVPGADNTEVHVPAIPNLDTSMPPPGIVNKVTWLPESGDSVPGTSGPNAVVPIPPPDLEPKRIVRHVVAPPESVGRPGYRKIDSKLPQDRLWNMLVDLGDVGEMEFLDAFYKFPPEVLKICDMEKTGSADKEMFILRAEVADKPAIVKRGKTFPGAVINLLMSIFPFDKVLQLLVRARFKLIHQLSFEPFGRHLGSRFTSVLTKLMQFLSQTPVLECRRLPELIGAFLRTCPEFGYDCWSTENGEWECGMFFFGICSFMETPAKTAHAACFSVLHQTLIDAGRYQTVPEPDLFDWRSQLDDWRIIDPGEPWSYSDKKRILEFVCPMITEAFSLMANVNCFPKRARPVTILLTMVRRTGAMCAVVAKMHLHGLPSVSYSQYKVLPMQSIFEALHDLLTDQWSKEALYVNILLHLSLKLLGLRVKATWFDCVDLIQTVGQGRTTVWARHYFQNLLRYVFNGRMQDFVGWINRPNRTMAIFFAFLTACYRCNWLEVKTAEEMTKAIDESERERSRSLERPEKMTKNHHDQSNRGVHVPKSTMTFDPPPDTDSIKNHSERSKETREEPDKSDNDRKDGSNPMIEDSVPENLTENEQSEVATSSEGNAKDPKTDPATVDMPVPDICVPRNYSEKSMTINSAEPALSESVPLFSIKRRGKRPRVLLSDVVEETDVGDQGKLPENSDHPNPKVTESHREAGSSSGPPTDKPQSDNTKNVPGPSSDGSKDDSSSSTDKVGQKAKRVLLAEDPAGNVLPLQTELQRNVDWRINARVNTKIIRRN